MHRCSHRGQEVKIGPYTILLGGTQYFEAGDADKADVLLPLTDTPLKFGGNYRIGGGEPTPFPAGFPQQTGYPRELLRGLPPLTEGKTYPVLAGTMVDFSPPPSNWADFLNNQVIPLLAEGKRVLAFCIGSHGRTGTLLASLIAILEPEVEDPITEARNRHCGKSVETRAQAAAVFALRGQEVPSHLHFH
jgi:hypothetical protein